MEKIIIILFIFIIKSPIFANGRTLLEAGETNNNENFILEQLINGGATVFHDSLPQNYKKCVVYADCYFNPTLEEDSINLYLSVVLLSDAEKRIVATNVENAIEAKIENIFKRENNRLLNFIKQLDFNKLAKEKASCFRLEMNNKFIFHFIYAVIPFHQSISVFENDSVHNIENAP